MQRDVISFNATASALARGSQWQRALLLALEELPGGEETGACFEVHFFVYVCVRVWGG